MKKLIIVSLIMMQSLIGGSVFSKDKLQCQSKCYKQYKECTKKSQKASNKLEKICKGDRTCTEKGAEQTSDNNSSCDDSLKKCTDGCEPKGK